MMLLPLAGSFLFGRGTGILVFFLLVILLVTILIYIIHRATSPSDVVGTKVEEEEWEI